MSGLVAANELRTRGLSVGIVESTLPGGLVANVGKLEGFPAPGEFAGAQVAAALLEQHLGEGGELIDAAVSDIVADGPTKTIVIDGGSITAGQIVLATGARLRRLDVEGEAQYLGRGVSQCAFCDASFFTERDVVVVGGGDGALQEALHLAQTCASVTLIHRRRRLRARQRYVELAADHPRLKFKWRCEVSQINGDEQSVTSVQVSSATKDPERFACDGVFIFVGLEPNVEYLPSEFSRDDANYLVVDAQLRTSVPGVYAVGAMRSGFPGQLTNAMGDGALAAATLVEDGVG